MKDRIPELSIVLPAYKEKENLAILVPQIEAEFQDTSLEVIVVDDHSNDGTRELLHELRARYGNVFLIERAGLFGIGSALREGYNKARGEYILSSDSDLSFSPRDMRRLYEEIRTGYDMVLGYYTEYKPTEVEGGEKRSGGHLTVFISRLSNLIIRTLSGITLRNYNTDFRIIRSSTWKRIRTVENRQFFLFETIFRAKQKGARIAEIPVTFYARKFGESKLNFFRQAFPYFIKLVRYTIFERAT